MNFNQELGRKIKKLRLNEKLTLTECSELTGLSVGFLSQIENGKTTISIDNLQMLARCLDVELNYFFAPDEKKQNVVITRKWSQTAEMAADRVSNTPLSDFGKDKNILPALLTLAPKSGEKEKVESYNGDVFFYVVDGILTLQTGDEAKQLFPGDAAHFSGKEGYAYWNDSPFVTHVFFAKKRT